MPSVPLFATVATVALMLCFPAASFAAGDTRGAGARAEQGESSATALRSADLLARGSGYARQAGSKAVRQLQLRLRGLGHRPGPVDGLFGPLTEASVERFQRARGLRVDGIVGPRTRARLLAVPVRRPAAPHGPATPARVAPDRPALDRPAPADVAPTRKPAPGAVDRPPAPGPEPSNGLDPWLAALLGAVGAGALLAGLSRLRRPRRGRPAARRLGAAPRSPRGGLNAGMAFAVLLAVFATGAAIGALFAARAAPGDRDGTEVASGALLSPPAASPRAGDARPSTQARRSRPAVAARERPRPPRAAPTPPTPAPTPATDNLPQPRTAPEPSPAGAGDAAPAAAPALPVAPVEEPSYTSAPDYSPAPPPSGQPEASSAAAAVAPRVKRLIDPDLEDRFASRGPDLLTAGEQPRQP